VTTQAVERPATAEVAPAHRRVALWHFALRAGRHLFLMVFVAFALLPVLLAFQASFKTLFDFYDRPLGLPSTWEWRNYVNVWEQARIPEYARNSVIVVGFSVPLIVMLSCLAAYGLTRYQFVAGKYIFLFFLAGLLVPIQLTILPTVFQLKTLKLVNTHAGLVISYVAIGLPFAVFLMSGFMRTLPRELAEAAHLDGAGEFRAF
jgi:N-acetylglucosamine transport system permease protein